MGILFSNSVSEYQINEDLCKACRKGSIELVNHYITNYKFTVYSINRAFLYACKGGNLDIVKLMIYIDGVSLDFNIGCECALDTNQFHIIDYLVANYNCPNYYYTCPYKDKINHRYVWIIGYKYNQLFKYTKLNENLINKVVNSSRYF